VAEKRAAQRVPRDGKRNAEEQRQRTAMSAVFRSTIAERCGTEKRVGDQPAARARWCQPARGRLRRGDGGCP
jgi:hypothetical protein